VDYAAVYSTYYTKDGRSLPNEFIAPASDEYKIYLYNYGDRPVTVSFKLTVLSTTIVGGFSTTIRSTEFTPLDKTLTLLYVWSTLGFGVFIGIACILLLSRRGSEQSVTMSESRSVPTSRVVHPSKFCGRCGAEIRQDNKFCPTCGRDSTES
jgi:ribosomal protein S27AE